MLNLFTELDADQQTVTDVEIRRRSRDFKPVKPRNAVLGEITSEAAIRYYTLAMRYRSLQHRAERAAKEDADTESEIAEQKRLASRYGSLSEMALNAFWFEARDQLDRNGSAWIPSSIGVRAGWLLVTEPEAEATGTVIGFGSGNLPPALRDLLNRLGGDVD